MDDDPESDLYLTTIAFGTRPLSYLMGCPIITPPWRIIGCGFDEGNIMIKKMLSLGLTFNYYYTVTRKKGAIKIVQKT